MEQILEVTSRALPGREADYEAWYRDVHVHDVLKLPGFRSAQRFSRVDASGAGTGDFVVHYRVETDDPAGLLQSLFEASATMELTDAIDPKSPIFQFLRPILE